jgi:hypothetical protein
MNTCLKCGSQCENKYCSPNCFNEHKKQKSSKNCLCCGKTWYRKSVSRKQSKYSSSKFHNCFCSKQCAKKYSEFECSRKARCRCGKATGQSGIYVCQECKLTSDWDALGDFSKCVRVCFDEPLSRWDRRCRNAVQSLKIRCVAIIGKETKENGVVTWDECVARQWKAMQRRAHQRDKQSWSKRVQNAVNLLGKRQRRKQLPQS